jgi:hypothetical protein
VGMRLPFWFALVVCTGSIGVLWMLARFMFLSARSGRSALSPLTRSLSQ